ncbi:Zn finger [Halorubrum tailed virus 25]|uniref:Zn finger n=1 Tax=Halorubrum tailed virus 25 TaxID=2878006 RepID=A0AAE8XY61_9CAUD|nr:Zn finger [Halorubrum tailed virus 25]UBF22625.1 Zn finger [Halorubrum tailed virus 25]
MPCDECGESAKENGSFGVVTNHRLGKDGIHRYTCMKCVKAALEEAIEN